MCNLSLKVLNEFLLFLFCIFVVCNVQPSVLSCLRFLRRSSECLAKRENNKLELAMYCTIVIKGGCHGLMAGMRMKPFLALLL
jgi:hypothetical protein